MEGKRGQNKILMEFLPYTIKWLEAILRWGHVLFAILWVGNSFLFNYLDNKLNKNITSKEIDGEGYLMHSGYYYKLMRLKTSPPIDYINRLVIFKWQSYLTFITGILLLAVIYYKNAGLLIVDRKGIQFSPLTAISLSLLSLIIGWIIYDLICKSSLINNKNAFLAISIIILFLGSYVLTELFSAKFAFLSVGLILGTNMFGNVFTVIIPNQMNIINSSKRNEKFDMSLSLAAKQRSIHNNYLTFLVLFTMLSGHYSFIVYHKYSWIILGLIGIILALTRHYFNLRGRNIHRLYILISSIISFIVLAFLVVYFK